MLHGSERSLNRQMTVAAIAFLVFVPLGIYKLCEIVYWIFSHVSVNVN